MLYAKDLLSTLVSVYYVRKQQYDSIWLIISQIKISEKEEMLIL
jgi:hypothetical protein